MRFPALSLALAVAFTLVLPARSLAIVFFGRVDELHAQPCWPEALKPALESRSWIAGTTFDGWGTNRIELFYNGDADEFAAFLKTLQAVPMLATDAKGQFCSIETSLVLVPGRGRVPEQTVGRHGLDKPFDYNWSVAVTLKLTVVAPTPDQLGELVLEASLSGEALDGLRFGGWQVKQQDGGWGTLIADEPEEAQEVVGEVVEVEEEPSNGWKTFPTVSDGIETVAVVVEFNIKGRTEQSDGTQTAWQWRPTSENEQQPYLRWLVQSDGTLRPLLKAAEKRKKIGKQAS